MGLSRLSKKCRECPFVDKCQNKRMEAEAYAIPVTMPGVAELAQPIVARHDYRDIKVSENTTITIDFEKLKKQLQQSHFPGMQFDYTNHGG